MKEKLITGVNVESDDKNYRTYQRLWRDGAETFS
jgi:hypothetical protein